MRTLIALILGFALGAAFILGMAPAPVFEVKMRAEAIPTVRLVKSSTEGGCSAVAIAPGFAMTAQHCMVLPNMTVDGHAVAKAHTYSRKDVVLLEVPGLTCPCARVARDVAEPGERLAAIGFPYGMGPHMTYGESQGDVVFEGEKYLLHTAGTTSGMSGGGVFALRGGRVWLTAITSRAADNGTAALSVDMAGIPLEAPRGPL